MDLHHGSLYLQKINSMKKILLLIIVIAFSACAGNEDEKTKSTGIENTSQQPATDFTRDSLPRDSSDIRQRSQNVTIKIIAGEESTFGYDIEGSSIRIHQPNIPGMPGNKGFRSKADAEKVAQLVAFKIRNNISPPSITSQELDSLGVK